MTAMGRRIEALELAVGHALTDNEAEALALQRMPFNELEKQVREILTRRDPPAEDDMSEYAVIEREVRKSLARSDAEKARQ